MWEDSLIGRLMLRLAGWLGALYGRHGARRAMNPSRLEDEYMDEVRDRLKGKTPGTREHNLLLALLGERVDAE